MSEHLVTFYLLLMPYNVHHVHHTAHQLGGGAQPGEGTMSALILSGTAKIGDEGIKKHFRSVEPWQPVFELAWNGFDAKAATVKIDVRENDMHSLESVTCSGLMSPDTSIGG